MINVEINFLSLSDKSVDVHWSLQQNEQQSTDSNNITAITASYVLYMRKDGEQEWNVVYRGRSNNKHIESLLPSAKYGIKLEANIVDSDNHEDTVTVFASLTTDDIASVEKRTRQLLSAIHVQDAAAVLQILSSKKYAISIDSQDKNGYSLLMLACRNGMPAEAVKALCEHGASVNIQTQSGKTPLMSCARVGNVEAIKVLAEFGAELDVQDLGGSTALMWACEYSQLEAVGALIELGADATIKDTTGCNGLLRTCALPTAQSSSELITLLVSKGSVDIDCRDANGCTPLMLAALFGRVELVECLVHLGANRSLLSHSGCTAQELAQSSGNVRVVKWLEDYRRSTFK